MYTSAKPLSKYKRNQILTRIIKELDYTINKTVRFSSVVYLIDAKKNLEKAIKMED